MVLYHSNRKVIHVPLASFMKALLSNLASKVSTQPCLLLSLILYLQPITACTWGWLSLWKVCRYIFWLLYCILLPLPPFSTPYPSNSPMLGKRKRKLKGKGIEISLDYFLLIRGPSSSLGQVQSSSLAIQQSNNSKSNSRSTRCPWSLQPPALAFIRDSRIPNVNYPQLAKSRAS